MFLSGQLSLKSTRLLIIGCGGLGSPASLYLSAAGIGTLGLLDNDAVDASNLHRQVIHTTAAASSQQHKVDSAIERLRAINPLVTYIPHKTYLTAENALDVFSGYDIVLDCSDNPATRYLVSDTAVICGIPLVSASALGTEGQLMVLNFPPLLPHERVEGDINQGGPCYRCVFPKPPPANTVMKCAEGGVLGPVVGVMGVMQAVEAIKAIITLGKMKKGEEVERFVPTLHLYSAYATPPFRSVKLRRRRVDCAACSAQATITAESLKNGCMDYVLFCGSRGNVGVLRDEERVSAREFKKRYMSVKEAKEKPILIDTRDKTQFGICSLGEDVINIPISRIMALPEAASTETLSSILPADLLDSTNTRPTIVMCRLGNDSQIAVRKLKDMGLDMGGKRYIGDLKGGLGAWKREVDPGFPEY